MSSKFVVSLSGRNGSVVIECVVGFGAVVHPTTGGFVSTIPNCGFAFERLSREIVELATGPVNLMEAMELDVNYRKTLTRECCRQSLIVPA